MGTIQLPQYQPQQISPDRTPRAIDVGGQVALGRAQSRLLDTAFSGIDLIADIAGKIRTQKITDEVNAARLKYKQQITTKMTELETNPLTTPQEEYPGAGQGLLEETAPVFQDLPNHKAFVDFRRQLMDDITKGMRYEESRKRFQLWADDAFVAEQDAVLTWDIAKSREIAVDNWNEQFVQAIELGDSGLALDLARSALEAKIITQKQYDDYLDDGYRKIAGRHALMRARAMGYEQGLAWLANPENLIWQTYKGEERRMSLQEQEDLVKVLQSEWDAARRAELERRRGITYATDNEYLQKLVRNDPSFTAEYIITDDRSAAYDGQPYNLREKYLGILAKRAEDALKGRDGPKEEDGYLTSEVKERYLDPNITPEDYENWIRMNTGYDSEGRLKIHQDLAVRYTDKAKNKPLMPNIAYGRTRLKEFFDDLATKAEKTDPRKADQLRKTYNQELTNFVEWLDNPDVAKELLRKPELIDQWVTNRIDKAVKDEIGNALRGKVIRPNEIRGGTFLAPLTEGERLQRMIQGGQLVGREYEFPAMDQYEEGVKAEATKELGRAPVWVKRMPDGQTWLFFTPPATEAGTAGWTRSGVERKYVHPQLNIIPFTYLEEKNDLKLKVWNGQTEKWEDPPDSLLKQFKPSVTVRGPTSNLAPRSILEANRAKKEMEAQKAAEEEGAARRQRILERTRR